MTVKFTDLLVKNLKPKDKEYVMRESGGFGVRVMPSGRKVFFFMYRVDGQRRFLNLGTYKDANFPNGVTLATAHAEFEAELSKVKLLKAGRAEGVDPVQEKLNKKAVREEIRQASTVDDLINDYIEKHAKKFKRSHEEDERLLMKDASPAWGKRKAVDIKKRDVVLVLERIVERGSPGTANCFFRCIRKMFNWAVEKDILEHSPCEGVKMPAPINTGTRMLSETEIRTLWHNLDSAYVSDEIKRAIKLIFVTAQRPGEVIGMSTDEIDKDGRWWTRAIRELSYWLNSYNDRSYKQFTVASKYLSGRQVHLRENSKIIKCLSTNGVALLSVHSGGNGLHYILAFKLAEGWLHCYDPYPRTQRYVKNDAVQIIEATKQQSPNLLIRSDWLDKSYNKANQLDERKYVFGNNENRECLLLNRIQA